MIKIFLKTRSIVLQFTLCFAVLLLSCNDTPFCQKNDLETEFTNCEVYSKILDSLCREKSLNLQYRSLQFLLKKLNKKGYYDNGGRYSEAFVRVQKERTKFKDSITEYSIHDVTQHSLSIFKLCLDSIDQSTTPVQNHWKVDSEFILPKDLLQNIELAIIAKEKNPLQDYYSEKDFLNFVLPHRVGNEPFEPKKRREFLNQYQWVFDSLKTTPLDTVVKKIYNKLEMMAVWGANNPFKTTPSMSQIEDTRFASCSALSSYLVNILRAVGIPSGIDFCPRFGNWHKSEGHSWVFYLTKTGFKSINIGLDRYETVNEIYKKSSLPKVFRELYDKNIDVTHLYKETVNFTIPLKWNTAKTKASEVHLAVFDKYLDWDIVLSASKVNRQEAQFNNVGANIIYLPVTVFKDSIYPLNYPFKVDTKGKIHCYNGPSKAEYQNALIERKFTPFLVRNRKEKIRRIRSINGLVLQGANLDKPEYYENIDTIQKISSSRMERYTLNKIACKRYFRLIGPKEKITSISELYLLNDELEEINDWKHAALNNNPIGNNSELTDHDPLTFTDKTNFQFKYAFLKKKCVSGIGIQSRTDDNNINLGDEYELLFWDEKWVSLGIQKAKTIYLTYNKVPKNSLFWLRNHSNGEEEFIFTINENGEQHWVGSSEYKKDDTMMLPH